MLMDDACTGFDVSHLQGWVCGCFNPNKLQQFSKQQYVKICHTCIHLTYNNVEGYYFPCWKDLDNKGRMVRFES